MKRTIFVIAYCIIIAILILMFVHAWRSPARADEITISGGTAMRNLTNDSARAWTVDYRHPISDRWAVSGTYINEGHIPGHKRDGIAVQAWAQAWPVKDRLAVAAGAGGYWFSDTMTEQTRMVVPGVAAIVGANATWYLRQSPYLLRATWQRIGIGNGDADLFAAGIGVKF